MNVRQAFTLVELLAVMAVMGILGTAAIGGYQAITRGISERGALQAAKGIAETARQRANIDRCRTYLFIYDEVQSIDSDDEPGRVSGLAIAVKGEGRISAVDGENWYDEFGDLDQQFRSLTKTDGSEPDESDYQARSAKFRLFSPRQKDFAIVRNGIRTELTEEDLEDGETHQAVLFGFRKESGSGGGGGASFVVGEEYAREFAVVRLPDGFTFSQSASTKSVNDLGLHKIDVHVFESNTESLPALTVYARRPSGKFEKVGSISEVEE